MAKIGKIEIEGNGEKVAKLLQTNSLTKTAEKSGYSVGEIRSFIRAQRRNENSFIENNRAHTEQTTPIIDELTTLDEINDIYSRLKRDLENVRRFHPSDFKLIASIESDLLKTLKLREDLRERESRSKQTHTEEVDYKAHIASLMSVLGSELRPYPELKKRLREALGGF
jgi:hypothetical protein